MATFWQGFDQNEPDEAKGFDLIESLAVNDGKIMKAKVDGMDSTEKLATDGSEGALVVNIDARITQFGKDNGISFGSMETIPASLSDTSDRHEDGPVLQEFWKPDGILTVGFSRLGFPDCEHDHLVQLLVCKNKHTRETLHITDKYDIAVAITHSSDGSGDPRHKMPDCQYMRIKSETKNGVKKSMAGVAGFLFRFHEQNTKYKINFALQKAPEKKKGKKKTVEGYSAWKRSEISITLETGSRVSGKPGKTREKAIRNAPPRSELGPASLSEESMELCKRSSWVMKQLQSLRDNAKWDDFDKYSSELLLQYPDTDTKITIKLEQSVAACYRNDLEGSIKLIDESFELMPQATNVYILSGRAFGYRSGVWRRQRSLGHAENDVQLAEQNNRACPTNLDTSFIVYERASVLLDFISRTPQRSPKQVNEALRNLEKCIDVCLDVEMQDSDAYVKKHHFALIKIAMLLLDCRTEAARDRVLSDESIAKGQQCLNTLKTKYWSEIPEGVKVQFNLASSDLEYRKGNYVEAERFARLAKDRAAELGFNTEISHAQERLDHTRSITRGDHRSLSPSSGVIVSASEGEYGDLTSSGSESDCLLRILE